MGKTLRREHIGFFTDRMDQHDRVISWTPVPNNEEYLFTVRRVVAGSIDDVTVHLTDAYRYGLAEFYARPSQLGVGSYIVIGMPHAMADDEVIEKAKEHSIGIGHVGKFMGALNYEKIWEYMTAEERRREEEKQKRNQT